MDEADAHTHEKTERALLATITITLEKQKVREWRVDANTFLYRRLCQLVCGSGGGGCFTPIRPSSHRPSVEVPFYSISLKTAPQYSPISRFSALVQSHQTGQALAPNRTCAHVHNQTSLYSIHSTLAFNFHVVFGQRFWSARMHA